MTISATRRPRAIWLEFLLAGVGALGAVTSSAQLLPAPRERAAPAPLAPAPSLQAATQLPAAQPRSFELVPGQRLSFGMPIGQAGPITAEVDVQGEAVKAWIERPDGGRIGERTVQGRVTLQAQSTAAEIATGPLWRLVLAAPSKAVDGALRAQPIARGTVKLSHPAADLTRVQAMGPARPADAGRPQDVLPLVQQEQKAINDREVQARQAQQQNALSQAVAALRAGAPLQKAAGTGSAPAPIQPGGSLLATRPLTPGAPAGSVAPVGAAGTSAQAAVASAPPALTVRPGRGSPGDIVTIEGSGLGTQAGTVQFTVAPGRALPATVVHWSDTGIVVRVPEVDGVAAAYSGPLAVAPMQGTARSVAFEFVPATEVRLIVPTLDQASVGAPGSIGSNVCHPACAWGFNLEYLMFGQRGEDRFFTNARLLNGWRVEGVGLKHRDGSGSLRAGIWVEGSADATMLENRVGTDSPFLRVGWWRDAGGSSLAYWPFIQIRGPKGTPHF
jgi:hypothetical protein